MARAPGNDPAEGNHVCVLTSVHQPFDVRVFHKECKSLVRAGYAVTLIAPYARDETCQGVQIKGIDQPRSRAGRMTKTVWQVYRRATEKPAEVYHFHDPELIPLGVLLRILGKKVVYDIHEDLPKDILTKHYIPRSIRRALGWFLGHAEDLACRWFSALVPATPAIGARFSSRNPRTIVVNNFPDLGEWLTPHLLPWDHREMAVAYVGGVSVPRGIHEAVRAMGLLPKDLSARLQIAGRFDPPSLLEEVAHYPGWSRVDFLGALNRGQVAALLGRVRAGVVTLLPVPSFVESLPVKLFEYMSAGLPVIASNFPYWRDIVAGAGCGILVDPGDPQDIARAIEHILTHPEEAEIMGKRGREAVDREYNWATEERKLLNLYASLLEPSCVE